MGKIIARDLRLMASQLYTMAVTWHGSRAAVTQVIKGVDFLLQVFIIRFIGNLVRGISTL